MMDSDMPRQEVVDFEQALRRLAGDEQILCDLAEIFLRESPRWMKRLEAAVSAGDAEEVFRAAHDIKGSTAIFAAASAVKAAKWMEKMGREESLEGADEALGALKAELVWVRNALKGYLER